MPSTEDDYSTYLAYNTWVYQIVALFSGFTFTAITILLTLLPDPSQIHSQVILFFLASIFDLFQFDLFYGVYYLGYCVRKAPPEARGRRTLMLLMLLSFSLWGLAIVLMFFLWNLMYLALASGTLYASFTILAYIFIWKPGIEYSKRLRSQK